MRRPAFPLDRASWFAGGLVALLCALAAWTGLAADPATPPGIPPATEARLDAACAALASPDALAGLDRSAGRALQERLRAVYRGDQRFAAGGRPLGDGVVGPVTAAWLHRFCVEFAVPERRAGSPGLVEAVHQFAGMLDAHPQERRVLASAALGRWIAAQPMPVQTDWVTTRLFGDDEAIAKLLAAYGAASTPGGPPTESDATPVYYELTVPDLEALAGPRKVLDGLAKMQDKPPINASEFDAAVTALLGASGVPAADMLPIVKRYAEPRPTQQITAEGILALKVRRLPPAAIALAQSVQDVPFPDRGELAAALEDAIQAASAEAAAKEAPKPVPAPSAAPAPAAPAPPAGVPAEGKSSPTADAAKPAPVVPVESAAAAPAPAPAPPPALKPAPAPNLAPFVKDIVKASVTREAFAVTDATLRGLAADPQFRALPWFLLKILDLMAGVEYPTDELYRAAVYAKVVDSFLESVDTPRPDKTLKAIDVIEAENPPPEFLAVVRSIASSRLRSSRAVRDALAADIERLTAPYLPTIEARARKPYVFRQTEVSRWNGGDCGCVLEDRLPGGGSTLGGRTNAGIVYGLFPIWQTGHEQLIDFTVLSSIGYYAVPFDDTGKLLDPLAAIQHRDDRLDFVDTAHRHGVRVDWVIRRVDWSSWKALDTASRARAFENLVDNIADMLQESTGPWLRKLASTLSLGGVPAPHRGDGVTLYFDNYPEDPPSIDAFKAFHQNLHNRLRETVGEQYSVNLLFPASAIGTGIHDCDHLAALLGGTTAGAPPNTGKFLVFLREPSIDSKKDLRQVIENCATGKRRKDLQQNIVPVIQYDGYSSAQLTDDVIYFDFNFGGVGLWPHPVASNAEPAATGAKQRVTVDQIGGDIRKILIGERAQTGKVQTGLDRICTFVCPNRWVFRGLFEAFLAFLLLSIVVRMINCRLNFALKARPAYFYLYMGGVVAPTLVLFLSLLYCDPAWEEIREGNIPFLLLAVVFIGFVIWLYIDARRQAAKP